MNLRAAFAAPRDTRSVLHCRPVWIAPIGWLALQAAALWPHGVWVARRVFDGSDDPLGLAAALLLAWLVWRLAPRLRPHPRLIWLAAAASVTTLATFASAFAPPLIGALLAALALSAALSAWLPAGVARAPLAGLAVLAVPLVSSLQFYVGYPLRALTAHLSAWGLQAVGIDAARSGASMLVRGQLVIVDAPCSGVQMAWIGYFVACSVAAMTAQRDAQFVRRLPLVGVLVLIGNTLRNSVLVALESRPQGLSAGVHEAIGLVALLAVCALVVRVMSPARPPEAGPGLSRDASGVRAVHAGAGRHGAAALTLSEAEPGHERSGGPFVPGEEPSRKARRGLQDRRAAPRVHQ